MVPSRNYLKAETMQTLSIELIETRLAQWRLFFESEQTRAVGFGTVLEENDPRLIQPGTDPESCDVENLIKSASVAGDPDLIELAELVGMLAQNYITRINNAMHDTMMQDGDDTTPCRIPRLPVITTEELEAALSGV